MAGIVFETGNRSKMASEDVTFIFEKIKGKNTLNNVGAIDNRLLSGEVKLIAKMGPNGLWSLNYSAGNLPGALQQRWTSLSMLQRDLELYFLKRNVRIKEVIE